MQSRTPASSEKKTDSTEHRGALIQRVQLPRQALHQLRDDLLQQCVTTTSSLCEDSGPGFFWEISRFSSQVFVCRLSGLFVGRKRWSQNYGRQQQSAANVSPCVAGFSDNATVIWREMPEKMDHLHCCQSTGVCQITQLLRQEATKNGIKQCMCDDDDVDDNNNNDKKYVLWNKVCPISPPYLLR